MNKTKKPKMADVLGPLLDTARTAVLSAASIADTTNKSVAVYMHTEKHTMAYTIHEIAQVPPTLREHTLLLEVLPRAMRPKMGRMSLWMVSVARQIIEIQGSPEVELPEVGE